LKKKVNPTIRTIARAGTISGLGTNRRRDPKTTETITRKRYQSFSEVIIQEVLGPLLDR
jgi:hypothetical protein